MLQTITDIPQMPSKFVEIVSLAHRQGSSIPFSTAQAFQTNGRNRSLVHLAKLPAFNALSQILQHLL